MKQSVLCLAIVLLSGCAVQWSPDYSMHEDIITGQELHEVSLTVTYPKKQFMTADEYQEFQTMPEHQQTKMIEAYKEREELEKKWKNFIEGVINRIL
jgi:hypothetical protein